MKCPLVSMLLMAALCRFVLSDRAAAEEPSATAAKPPAPNAADQAEPSLRQQQIDFDRLAGEYDRFANADYIIEPPDILRIEGVDLVPNSSHRINTFDRLVIRIIGALPEQPVGHFYDVDADGTVDLGAAYGRVNVAGLTIKKASEKIRDQLSKAFPKVEVLLTIRASADASVITGQHLVEMDGRVKLGSYGNVYVAGMTVKEASDAIELKLAERFDDPEASVDVMVSNSKVFYVVTVGAGLGDDVTRLPISFPADGPDTIGQAMSDLFGDPEYLASPDGLLADATITLRRPAVNGVGPERAFAIRWDVRRGAPTPLTDHCLLPGDRLFIEPTERALAQKTQQPVEPVPPSPAEPAPR